MSGGLIGEVGQKVEGLSLLDGFEGVNQCDDMTTQWPSARPQSATTAPFTFRLDSYVSA